MAGDDERKAGRDTAAATREPAGAAQAPREPPTPNATHTSQTPPLPPPPPPPREREMRSPLDVLPEILRRGLSAGRDVSESLIPRELASTLAAQLVDARHGLVNAIATEVGRFLRQADIASEMRKVLAGLRVEAKIELKFSEDSTGKLQTKVETTEKTQVSKSSKPPPSSTPAT